MSIGESPPGHVAGDDGIVARQHDERAVAHLHNLAVTERTNICTALGYDAFEQVAFDLHPVGVVDAKHARRL